MVDASIISAFLTNLASLINDELSILSSFKRRVKKLSGTLTTLTAVLEDAERRIKPEDTDKQTEDWLRKLKCVAYEVRDIMGECRFEELRLQVKKLNASSSSARIQVTNCIAHPFSITWTRLKIGHKINDVLEKLDQVSSERNNLHLREIIRDKKSDNSRQTISKLIEKVYGRDKEKEKIVNILVNGIEKLSVLPIFGLGGLGKTTLAKMVFNDEKITKCFDVKFWVCVSEVFDKSVVIKAIIGATIETSLEILQNKIEDKLRGKKYLIVLDDVWNEDVGKWDELRGILDCGLNGSFIITTTRKRNVAEVMKKMVQPFELSSLSDDDCWKLFEERAFMYEIPKTINYIGIGKKIAQKCKGVPLIAKALGSQLGFKKDEKYWCTIRDNDMWQISENKKSFLPILSLSYYDLPYHLRRCFAFCAIFPKDTVIKKERLIQMWMANDLISTNENQEVEDVGNQIWDELCWRTFFQEEKKELIGFMGTFFQEEKEELIGIMEYCQTCKMHDFMHDLAQSVMKDECYTLDDKNSSSSKEFGREIRHLTVRDKRFGEITIDSLKKIEGLQSILLYPYIDITILKKILSFLKEFSSLRVFDVSGDVQSQDLHYVGCLKHLRYLDLSNCREIKTLPDSICDLLNLQTLNLDSCYFLESLPENTKNLINLRHLHLKDCYGLKYMPRGMRQLRHLKRLSVFVIGKESDGQLEDLNELDIEGCMEIKNLGRVSDASIERGGLIMSKKSKKSSLSQLELKWEDSYEDSDEDNDEDNDEDSDEDSDEDNDETKNRHEKIGEALEVSFTCLERLEMRCYKGVNIPKCVGESSASLIYLSLYDLDNVKHLFTMNNMNGTADTLFPLLQQLVIFKMKNLRELVSPDPISITAGAFPNLCKICIYECPKLGALPPHLKSLKEVGVGGECSDELLYSISNLTALTHLDLVDLRERSVLFGGGGNYNYYKEDNEAELGEGGPPASSTFQSLQSLHISGCDKLSRLFHDDDDDEEGCEKLARRRGGGSCLTNLNSLLIEECPELMISVEQWRNLITHSLQYLFIKKCPKLVPSSKVEAYDEVIALLWSLRERLGSDKFVGDILHEEDLRREKKKKSLSIPC